MLDWIIRRIKSKWFWILGAVVVLDEVIFFIPFIPSVILIGLFYNKLLRWIAKVFYQYCDEVEAKR